MYLGTACSYLRKRLRVSERSTETQELNITGTGGKLQRALWLLDDSHPMTLHLSAFMTIIESQGSDEQQKSVA